MHDGMSLPLTHWSGVGPLELEWKLHSISPVAIMLNCIVRSTILVSLNQKERSYFYLSPIPPVTSKKNESKPLRNCGLSSAIEIKKGLPPP
jgi:hypothetical protein